MKRTGLLTAVFCVMIAATAAMAGEPWQWELLDSTPYPVGYDAHIVCGDGRIWGMFNSADTETFVYDYYPLSPDTLVPPDTGEWHPNEWDEAPFCLTGAAATFTGMTFDWQHNTLWAIVGDTSDTSYGGPDGTLWQYNPSSGWWDFDIEDDTSVEPRDFEFFLDSGACITYAPNLEYGAMNQAAGYIYCLPGLSRQSWRFAIEPDADIVCSGVFPPNGSTIADKTPLFQWDGMSIQYRLQVSTDPLFSTTVIDEVVFDDEYQTQSKLADTLYYWRTGTPSGGGNWNFAAALSFTEVGEWKKLDNLPTGGKVYAGAAMAYYAGHIAWGGEPRVYALTGGNDPGDGFYSIGLDDTCDWVTEPTAPKTAWSGTSLTTSATGGVGWCLVAVFGSSVNPADQQYGFEPGQQGRGWFRYSNDRVDPLPQDIGPGGACALSGSGPWTYLITGAGEDPYEPNYYFYAIDPNDKRPKKDKDGGGSQAGDVPAGDVRAQALASNNGVKVEYQLSAAAYVRATLHDAVGRQVDMLDIGVQQPGTHRLSWSQDRGGQKLASGAYFVLLDMGMETATLKAIIR